MSVKQGFGGLLVLLALAFAGSQQALAAGGGHGGGGGGGGFHGGGFGGGGFHGGSFGGGGFHGSSFGGGGFHGSVGGARSFSAPSISHFSAPSVSHFSSPSISHFNSPSISHFSSPSISHFSSPSVSHFSSPSMSHFSSPSINRGAVGTPLHTYTGNIRSGNTVNAPLLHSFNNSTPGTRGPTLRGGNISGLGTNIAGRGTNVGGLTLNHPVNPLNWQHNAKGSHDGGIADRGFDRRGFDRDFDHDHFFGGYYGYGGLGFYDPFLWSWWPYSLGYDYGYPYYGYNYGYDYGTPYAYYGGIPGYGSYDNGAYSGYGAGVPADTTAYAPVDMSGYGESEAPAAGGETSAGADWGTQFLASARQAFLDHQYSDALRLASHASLEEPKDAKVHELMALAMFALKDYRGANMEAHAALSLAPAGDWPTLYGYYQDLPTYKQQLDDLVTYIRAHPDAADARFVLAYHDLMLGDKGAAKIQFDKVVSKVPQDQLAITLLRSVGGTPPATTAQAVPGKVPASPASQPKTPETPVPAPPTR